MFDALTSVLPYVRSGKLKVIAAVSDFPFPDHPEYPLLKGLLPSGAAMAGTDWWCRQRRRASWSQG